MKRVRVTADVEVPMVPNFLKYGSGGMIDVAHMSDADLRTIGACWVNALLENAKKRRTTDPVKP